MSVRVFHVTRLSWVAIHGMAHSLIELDKAMVNVISLISFQQSWKQKDMTLKDELPRSIGAQYATGEEWRNNSKKNDEIYPKQK